MAFTSTPLIPPNGLDEDLIEVDGGNRSLTLNDALYPQRAFMRQVTAAASSDDGAASTQDDPVCVEGLLYCKKGRSAAGRNASFLWKKRFVSVSLFDGGSVTVYKGPPNAVLASSGVRRGGQPLSTSLQTVYSKIQQMSKIGSALSPSAQRSVGSTTPIEEENDDHDHDSRESMPLPGVPEEGAMEEGEGEMGNVDIHIPAYLPWMVKDVANDHSNFVVEIPPPGEQDEPSNNQNNNNDNHESSPRRQKYDSQQSLTFNYSFTESGAFHDLDDLAGAPDQVSVDRPLGNDSVDPLSPTDNNHHETKSEGNDRLSGATVTSRLEDDFLMEDLSKALSKGKIVRIYFRCNKGRNEKALWLQAFSRLGRLSSEVRRRKTLLGSLTSPVQMGLHQVRIRRHSNAARGVRQLELVDEGIDTDSVELTFSASHVEDLARGKGPRPLKDKDKEFRVHPIYAYPHRWMTRDEINQEMVLPSETFHDLRVPNCDKPEVGSLRVEVLQCLGLPKLDRTGYTDAIVYMVCGSYAFATDVIPNRANPMWPRKSRRACEFPIYHAWARLFVGVFDDDRKRVKDEFAGRVVVDIARLRPWSTYDVTLPLRLSTSVYSRRRRGAIRLRFTLKWKTEREALMSYIPNRIKIPLPQNSRPNVNTTVLCSDKKAFRNIAITVHGAHLPGKFTFQEMRAAIREINFTRKHIFTSLRTWQRDIRRWQYPTMSAFVFLAWMHCIYANQFSLVPAYAMLYFVIHLMSNYAKYGTDRPVQRGFVPPSWEEMFAALLRGGDPDYHAIEPLELHARPLALRRRRMADSLAPCSNDFNLLDYRVKTHKPKGKAFFRTLGLLNEPDPAFVSPDDDHLEFPFANGTDYPKFTVKEALVHGKGEGAANEAGVDQPSCDGAETASTTVPLTSVRFPEMDMPDVLKNMELLDIMRKDSSGLRSHDEEEDKFATRFALYASGKKAASTATKAAKGVTREFTDLTKEITEKSGLHHVVNPITQGITSGVHQVSSGVQAGMHQVMAPVSKASLTVSKASHNFGRRLSAGSDHSCSRHSEGDITQSALSSAHSPRLTKLDESALELVQEPAFPQGQSFFTGPTFSQDEEDHNVEVVMVGEDKTEDAKTEIVPQGSTEIDPLFAFPEQNVDVEGPSTGNKLTDDLAEIKEKIHELTWNLFNDKLYVIKNRDACYFGQAKKAEKRRKADVNKELDKLLRVNQYSHSNPFVARVGLYVEPIIGSAYSFLCVFRAGFNVMTWRDPLLSFWLSVITGSLALVLFIFPWRIFLFVLGVLLVGPQNWVIRLLRETGYLPPLKPRPVPSKTHEFEDELPTNQPLFSISHLQQNGTSKAPPVKEVDPREVHRVVVPYSPLMYNRFYDWPPEPQYATVKRVPYNSNHAHGPNQGALPMNRVSSFDYPRRRAATFSGGSTAGASIGNLPSNNNNKSYFRSSTTPRPGTKRGIGNKMKSV